jgi:excinuclease ABC subunit C
MASQPLSISLTNPIFLSVSFGEPPFRLPSDLPSSPGVYIFADEKQNPLYIGKSINLKSRLAQHFESAHSTENKAAHFIGKTHYLILQTVESDLAAIILEANLIKTYQPYYNSATKDDKTVSYIVIGNTPNSQISVLHKSDLHLTALDSPRTQIYGPYPSSQVAGLVLKHARRIFGFCQNPDNPQKRACFYFHIGQCPGPCNGTISPAAYAKHLTRLKNFLSGKFKNLIATLKKEINLQSKKQEFENAQVLKKQLQALEIALSSHKYSQLLVLPAATQKVLDQAVLLLKHPRLISAPQRIECYDMATLNQENTVGVMVVFTNGRPDKDNYRKFLVKTTRAGDPHTMRHIMARRLRHPEWERPDLIILDGGVPQLSIVSEIIPPDIPVIALSKKRETIHFYDESHQVVNLNLPLHNSVLKLFQFTRDEAHRFATTYHKKRRQMTVFH